MVCNKHPSHRQSPGVCSVCLGERLSQLSASSSGSKPANKDSVVSSSSISFSSSYYSSLEGSPVHHKYRMGSLKHVTRWKQEDVFRKSKSLAAIEREREIKNKKKGFWSKLLGLRKKKIEVGLDRTSIVTATVH